MNMYVAVSEAPLVVSVADAAFHKLAAMSVCATTRTYRHQMVGE